MVTNSKTFGQEESSITDAILCYIKTPHSGALMISGKWGCGKTHHIDHVVFPKLRELDYVPIRVSLFGMSNIDEFPSKLLDAYIDSYGKSLEKNNKESLFNKKTKAKAGKLLMKGATALSSLKKITDVVDVEKLFRSNNDFYYRFIPSDKTILVLDDLERAIKTIDIHTLLGAINDLIEQREYKVVVVSNNTYLDDNNKDHLVFKEKVIEKTVSEFKQITDTIREPSNRNRIIAAAVILVVMIGAAVYLNTPDQEEVETQASKMVFAKAKVTAVLSDDAQPDYSNAEGRRVGSQELEIKILTGSHKDEIMTLTNYMSALYNVDVEKGDRIIVRILTDEDGLYYASMFNYNRGMVMGIFILIFFVALIALGGKKGLGAMLGLLFTLLSIWYILIPCIMRGMPSILVTVLIISITAAGSLILLNGFSTKTLCAILGCVCGVVAAGVIAAVVGAISPMNGFNMSEAENLILYGADEGLKVSGLLVCGVLIAALGAVMDVSLGIASSIWELHCRNPQLEARELFRSGMHIGRDAMGTMANTLILAFAGSSLNMLILVQTYGIPFIQLVNTDYIFMEVLQSVSGSMGILLSVPIVALISAQLMTRKKHIV